MHYYGKNSVVTLLSLGLIPAVISFCVDLYNFQAIKHNKKDSWSSLRYGCKFSNDSPMVVLGSVKITGMKIQYASSELKARRDIVIEAVKQNGLAIQYAIAELQGKVR